MNYSKESELLKYFETSEGCVCKHFKDYFWSYTNAFDKSGKYLTLEEKAWLMLRGEIG